MYYTDEKTRKGLGVDTIIEAGMKLEYLRLQEKRIENEEK